LTRGAVRSATSRVARAVRKRRQHLGLSLRALAARSEVSASMISDIERGEKSPTIVTLAALAEALRIPISGLVDSATSTARRIRVVRASERSRLIDKTSGAQRDSFGPTVAGSRVEFLRYTMLPRTAAGPFAAHETGTIEHVHVAAGRIRFVLGTDSVLLEAGDSCTCLADAPHSFDNRDGNVEALIYLVIEPP
jgi:transcriptional regulator with XRE-family HTH domain